MSEAQTRWPQKEKIIYWLIILTGISLRFLFLDERPLHHDESLHAQYGHYFFDNPRENFYRYDPLLHGPLLYHLLPFIYWIFGVTQSSLRFIPALAGSILLFFPLAFKRSFSPSIVLWATALLAFSPTFSYWSRFLGHDMLIVLFLSATLILCTVSGISKKIRLPLLAVVIGLQFCLKVNAYLHFLGLAFLFIFDFLYHHKSPTQSLLLKTYFFFKNSKTLITCSFFLSLIVFAYFYTAGFQYPQGFLDGLYRESLSYWWEQHQTERIAGPFSYYLLLLGLYEPVFVLSLACVPYLIFKSSRKHFVYTCLSSLFLFGLLLLIPGIVRLEIFKLKLMIDLCFYSFLLCFFVVLCYISYRDKKYILGRMAFFFGAFTTIYSFAGEKVPWLALYPLFFSLCFLIIALNFEIKEKLLKHTLFVCITIGFGKNIYINFVNPGSSKELISQVHTSKELEQALKKLEFHLEQKHLTFLAHPQVLWPTSWYMYGSNFYSHLRGKASLQKWDYILAPSYDQEYFSELSEDYDYIMLSFRHWWEPDYSQLSMGQFLKTFLTHVPWNESERMNVYLFERKKFNKEFLKSVQISD